MTKIDDLKSLLAEHSEKSNKFHNDMRGAIEKQNRELAEIHFILTGNKKANIEGLSQLVSRHEKYIEGDKKAKWLVAGGIMGANGLLAWFMNKFGL